MASPIIRPRYSEGQVLAAADLEAQVTYSRTDSAIHERTEHTPGVAAGLGLELRDERAGAGNVEFGQLWVLAGVAVDTSGRRIVLPEDQQLTERDFVDAGVFSRSDPLTTRYPIFLVAVEEGVNSRAAGRCGADAATRIAETFQLEFGRPGSEQAVLRPTAQLPPGSGPGSGGKVLLGFATWNQTVVAGGGFTGALSGPEFGVRFAGVRASVVEPHRGRLVLATSDGDPRFALILSEDEAGGARLRFLRQQQGTDAPSPLFSVDDRGDVFVAGKINSAIPQLPVQMAGSLSHGLKLPLPSPITEEMVSSGRVRLDYVVSPHLARMPQEFPGAPAAEDAFPTAIESYVDGERRLHCRFRWQSVPNPARTVVTGGTADYLLTATPVE